LWLTTLFVTMTHGLLVVRDVVVCCT